MSKWPWSRSPAEMHAALEAVRVLVPGAEHRTLPGDVPMIFLRNREIAFADRAGTYDLWIDGQPGKFSMMTAAEAAAELRKAMD